MAIVDQMRVKPIGGATSDAEAALEERAQAALDEIAALGEDNLFDRVDLLWKLGRLYETHEKDEKALEAYRRAVEDLRQLGEDVAQGQLLHACGLIESKLGRARNAHKCLIGAQELLEKAGETDLLGIVHLDRGAMLGRSNQLPAAHAALNSAAKCFAEVGNALAQGHAHFFLGEFEATLNPDRARWKIDRARMFYQQWASEHPREGSMRIATPQAPTSVDDPRTFEADEMVAYCEVRCAQLQAEAARRNSTEGTEPPKAAPVPVNEALRIAGVLAAVSAIGIAIPLIWTLLGVPFIEPQIFHVAIAGAVLITAFAGMLYVGTDSRMTQFLAPVLPCVFVYHVNANEILMAAPAARTEMAAAQQEDEPAAADSRKTQPLATADPQEMIAAAEKAVAGEPEAARDWLVDAAAEYDKANDQVGRAAALLKAVNLDAQLGDVDGQRRRLMDLAEAQRLSDQPAAELAALRDLAGVEALQGRSAARVDTFTRIAAAANRSGARADEGAAYVDLARAARSSGAMDKAIAALASADAIYHEIGDTVGRGDVEMERARNHSAQELVAAAKSYNEALSHYRAGASPRKEAEALLELGNVDVKLGRAKSAERHFDESAAVCRRAADASCEGRALFALASVPGRDTRGTLARAVASSETSGDHGLKVDALIKLADAESLHGDETSARDAQADAFAACDEVANPLERAEAYLKVGKKAEEVTLPDRAKEAYSEALRTYEQIHNRPGQIAALRHMRQLSHGVDPVLAERYAKRITRIEEELRRDS